MFYSQTENMQFKVSFFKSENFMFYPSFRHYQKEYQIANLTSFNLMERSPHLISYKLISNSLELSYNCMGLSITQRLLENLCKADSPLGFLYAIL